jgi:hypothetical protein
LEREQIRIAVASLCLLRPSRQYAIAAGRRLESPEGWALYLDDDTIRHWHSLFETTGVSGLLRFELGGSFGFLTGAQEAKLHGWIVQTLPRSTRLVGAHILKEFGVAYESAPG